LKKLSLIILLVIGVFSAKASTEVFGNAKDYANSELVFYKYSDRITFLKDEVFRITIDANGDFKTNIDVN